MTDEQHLKARALVKKYSEGNCTAQEKDLVEQWYLHLNNTPNDLTDKEVAADLLELEQRLSEIPSKKLRLIPYLRAVAAVILACLSISLLWNNLYNKKTDAGQHKNSVMVNNDILPGGNRAILTLDKGQAITLNEDKKSLVSNGNSITYEDGTAIQETEKVQMATLSTPIAAQYQVVLPDGTHAWLNAKSSITYPTRFTQSNRIVSITGEVNLQVAKDRKRPFIVNTGQQRIEVLGTSFNVNAYGDEGRTLTTLSEGSLRVVNTKFNSNALLVPGQQAAVSNTENIQVQNVDIEEASSWKYGLCIINDKPLSNYALQIERWYDVKIDMQSYGNTRLSAIIPRDAKLSEVLQAISLKTGVKFQVEGRRVLAIK